MFEVSHSKEIALVVVYHVSEVTGPIMQVVRALSFLGDLRCASEANVTEAFECQNATFFFVPSTLVAKRHHHGQR